MYFNKVEGTFIYLLLYVDDISIVAKDIKSIKEINYNLTENLR